MARQESRLMFQPGDIVESFAWKRRFTIVNAIDATGSLPRYKMVCHERGVESIRREDLIRLIPPEQLIREALCK
jgi:hypothetical protein